MKIFFDFETRSALDLKKVGAHVYAKHYTTDVVCLAWSIDQGPVKLYRHLDGDPPPVELFEAIRAGGDFIAHNAAFERLMWRHVCHERYAWPALPTRQLYCTMVMAYAMGLMGALENAAKCVGLSAEKDMHGHRVMLQLAKPRSLDENGEPLWWERADSKPKLDINEKYEQTYKYCMQDIIVMRELYYRLLPLDQRERETWLLDQKINDRGVYVDEHAAVNAINMANIESQNLNKQMRFLTDQAVSSCNAHTALKKWVNDRGVETESVDKSSVIELLEKEDLPKEVRKVLDVRQSAAKSSVNKINMMLSSLSDLGRVQGCFQFLGAASTGRWAGRRIQLQNMQRPTIKQEEIEEILKMLGEAS